MTRILSILLLLCASARGQATRVVKIWEIPNSLTTVSNNDLLVIADMNDPGGPATKKITYGDLTAGLGGGSGQTNWPVAAITNAGTAAYSNATAFLTPAQVGTAAYSNSSAFVQPSQIGTAAYSNTAAFLQPSQVGTAAYSNASAFVESPTNSPSNNQVVSRTGDKNKWVTPTTGTVTSVGVSGPVGFTWTGSPVTGAGTLTAVTPGMVVTNGFDQSLTISNALRVTGTATFAFGSEFGTITTIDSDGNVSFAGGLAGVDLTGMGTFNSGINAGNGGITWGGAAGILGNDGSATFASGGASISSIGAVNSLTLQSTILAGTGDRLVQADVAGNVSATIDVTAFPIGNISSPGNIITNGQSIATALSNAVTVTGNITNTVLSANAAVITDANKALKSVATGGSGTYLEGTTPPAYSSPPGVREWAGNTGNALIGAAVTAFYAPNGNSQTNVMTSDTSTFTRNVATRTTTFTNLYIILSAGPGASRSCTVTLMTNGVASSVVATATGAATTGNSGSTSDTIVAGVEFGIRIGTVASATATKVTWGLEGIK